MTASGPERLAVIVPLKDEAAGIPALAAALEQLRVGLLPIVAVDFVLVDDGSVDDTWVLLQERFAAAAGFRLERHDRNRGLAAAIRTGIRTTDAAVCGSIDADLSYDPMEIAAMLPLLADADVVTASPYHHAGGVSGVPGWRLLLSRTLSRCYRLLLRSEVATWTSCFRLYRRAAVADLPLDNDGFLGTAELLVRVLRRGGTVREHPCVLGVRRFGASKMKVLRTIAGHLGLLARVALRRVS
ncbi:MAG: glycosyltransferase family 2 protein [Planctomycetes bacterium]|nr:glycosyltransferase family 2 protein [Planctomycetota bacterium]